MTRPQGQPNRSRRVILQTAAISTLAAISGCAGLLSSGGPTEQWRVETADRVHCPPVVLGRTVFVGSGDTTIYALATTDGTQRWRFETEGAVEGVRVHGSRVLCGSEDGHVYSLARSDGSKQWRASVGDEVMCQPAVAGDTVIVNPRGYVIYGLSLSQGRKRWTHGIETPTHLSEKDRDLLRGSPADPVVVDGLVIVGSYDRHLYALDSQSGEVQWTVEMDGLTFTTPAVADGAVYAGSLAGDFYALDAATGERLWRRRFPDRSIARAPAADTERVYTCVWPSTQQEPFQLVALDAETGERLWTNQVTVSSGLTLADDALVFGSEDGTVYSVSTDGKRNWQFKDGGRIRGAPAVHDGRVYFGSGDRYVYAIEP